MTDLGLTELQDVAFRAAKGGLLRNKRTSITTRKATFYNVRKRYRVTR